MLSWSPFIILPLGSHAEGDQAHAPTVEISTRLYDTYRKSSIREEPPNGEVEDQITSGKTDCAYP